MIKDNMIKDNNEIEYSLLNDDNDNDKTVNNTNNNTNNTKNRNNIIIILSIFFAMSVSTICSLYIVLIYQDVHNAYLSVQNLSLSNINITELYLIRNQLEFLNYCVSEKYCKRIH